MIAGHVGALPSTGQLQWRVRHRAWGSAARRRRAVVSPRATAEVTRLSDARPATSPSIGRASSSLALASDGSDVEVQYLSQRAEAVTEHFETALGIDDFVQRLEIALWAKGFTNENTIAMVNLCRDEVTQTMKHKIDQIFGSSFNVNGLGGVLTCGATGMGAGLSHSPVDEEGRERYVFFSFPHIAIDAKGMVGHISRPGRSSVSCACGALIKSLGEIKKQGIQGCRGENGVHEPLDFEYSILKHRLAKRLEYEGFTDSEVEEMDLVKMTKVAERTITQDLEFLISKAVDVNKADYAVVTGVQIHNWGADFEDEEPNLEFVAPTSVYVVVNGKKTYLNLKKVPGLTPRQIRLLATAPDAHSPAMLRPESAVCNSTGTSTLREVDPPYMYKTPEARRSTQEQLEKMTGTAPALPAPEEPSMVLVHDAEVSAVVEESSLQLEFAPSPAPAEPADAASATQKYYTEVYQAPASQKAPAPAQSTPLSADDAYYASVYQTPATAAAPAAAPVADEPAWSTHATINDSAVDQEYYTAQYYSTMYENPAEPFATQPRRWEAPRQNGSTQASSAEGAASSAVKPTLEVEFAIQCNAGFGNNVAVVGDVDELGAWDPKGALLLEWSEGDVWIGTVQLPPGVVSFKVVKLLQGGGVEWEDSENRSFSLPERFLQLDCHCKVHVSCHYNGKAADTLVEAGAEWVPMAANGNGNGTGNGNGAGTAQAQQVDVAALNGTEPCLEPGNGAKDNGLIVALTDSSPTGKRQQEDLLARFNALTNKRS